MAYTKVKSIFVTVLAMMSLTIAAFWYKVQYRQDSSMVSHPEHHSIPEVSNVTELRLKNQRVDDLPAVISPPPHGDKEPDQSGTHNEVFHDTDSGKSRAGGRCVLEFLNSYEQYCEQWLKPHESNLLEQSNTSSAKRQLCPCVPKQLLGSSGLEDDLKAEQFDINKVTGSAASSRWYPTTCQARHRIAVLVPFRKRDNDLERLIKRLQPFLRLQLLDFTIFVIEQVEPRIFNRGSLLNVGFLEANKQGHFDCCMLHDVDMLPIDDRNFYTCSATPRHVGKFRDNRVFSYAFYFGGVVAISPQHFERANGFSNRFYGWGGEDDDFRMRVIGKDRSRIAKQFPKCVGRFTTTAHARDNDNPTAPNKRSGRRYRPRAYRHDGLNSIHYKILNYSQLAFYTRISVSLPPP